MDDSIQFDRAELSAPPSCGACKAELRESYFRAAGQTLCGTCADQVRALMDGTGSRAGRLLRSALFGIGAGILGGAIYYGVLALTGYNVGLVAIVVGVLVGRAVRKGSGNRGGLAYQFMAAGITYLAIASTFVPMALTEFKKEKAKEKTAMVATASAPSESVSGSVEPAAPIEKTSGPKVASEDPKPVNLIIGLGALLVLTLSLPILAAFGGGVISLLIVGFGVWEAWRVNKRIVVNVTGPHPITVEVPALPSVATSA